MNNFLLVYTGGGMPETEEEQAEVFLWSPYFTQFQIFPRL